MDRTFRQCLKCHADLPSDAHHRRRYCNDSCAATARTRRYYGRPEADAPADLDGLLANKELAVATLQRKLATTENRTREVRRLRTQLRTTDRAVDKRVATHGHLVTAAHGRTELATATANELRSTVNELLSANRDLEKQLAAIKNGQRPTAKLAATAMATIADTVATTFDRMANEYINRRRGSRLEDFDYLVIEQSKRNKERLAVSGQSIELRTIYYFAKLTKYAYESAGKAGLTDTKTRESVTLYNNLFKIISRPKQLPSQGKNVTLPNDFKK